jgi:hypothetical protein
MREPITASGMEEEKKLANASHWTRAHSHRPQLAGRFSIPVDCTKASLPIATDTFSLPSLPFLFCLFFFLFFLNYDNCKFISTHVDSLEPVDPNLCVNSPQIHNWWHHKYDSKGPSWSTPSVFPPSWLDFADIIIIISSRIKNRWNVIIMPRMDLAGWGSRLYGSVLHSRVAG